MESVDKTISSPSIIDNIQNEEVPVVNHPVLKWMMNNKSVEISVLLMSWKTLGLSLEPNLQKINTEDVFRSGKQYTVEKN